MSEPENYCQLYSRHKLGFNTKNLSLQKINRLRETIRKYNFSKIGKGKQLT